MKEGRTSPSFAVAFSRGGLVVVLRRLLVGGGRLLFSVLVLGFFQGRVLLQLGGNLLTQFQRGHLQQLDGLLQRWCHDQTL